MARTVKQSGQTSPGSKSNFVRGHEACRHSSKWFGRVMGSPAWKWPPHSWHAPSWRAVTMIGSLFVVLMCPGAESNRACDHPGAFVQKGVLSYVAIACAVELIAVAMVASGMPAARS